MIHSWYPQHTRAMLACSALALGLALSNNAPAQSQTAKSTQVQPLQGPIAEETFQTLLVAKAMTRLGYDVLPIKEVEYPSAHIAVANGDATFMANHWDPMHADFYKNAGGDAKLSRTGSYASGAVQGYLIDKKTADEYNITHITQLADPKIAALFDHNGDGKASLTGCNPGWGCEALIEHHLDAYKLRDHITHIQGNYAALIADTLARFKRGKPILYYTWTPYWVSGELRPGHEVVWLQVPFSSSPGEPENINTQLPDGKNYGFVINTQRIVANKAFVNSNPAAAKLFEIMRLPISDINAQNLRMRNGQNKPQDIERHVNAWIKGHQKVFDGWIEQARAAGEPK